MNKNDFLNNLTDEQKAKAKNCKTAEEFIALANEEGIELTDEQLEGLAGGWAWDCIQDGCRCFTDCPVMR